MLNNFTLIDVTGTVEATVFMTLICFVPGYVMGWLSNAFGFRKQRFLLQALISTPLAVSILPISVYWVGRYPRVLWLLLGTSFVVFPIVTRRTWVRWIRVHRPALPRRAHLALMLGGAWLLIVLAILPDL